MVIALKDFFRPPGQPTEPDLPSQWVRVSPVRAILCGFKSWPCRSPAVCSGTGLRARVPLCSSVPTCEMGTLLLPLCGGWWWVPRASMHREPNARSVDTLIAQFPRRLDCCVHYECVRKEPGVYRLLDLGPLIFLIS